MALRRPNAFGGPELPEQEFRSFQEAVARRSGALAFLQTQHQSAVSMIAKGTNEALKTDSLPYMADGKRLIGIGFSQLRRPGKPLLAAEPEGKGFRLSGTVPWITGWSFYPEFLVGAALDDNRSAFGIVPFENRSEMGGKIEFGPPMQLAAMESALTVSANFDNWHLDEQLVVDIKPAEWIHTSDEINIVLQAYFALGAARAGLDNVWAAFELKGTECIGDAWRSLDAELENCRESMAQAQGAGAGVTTRHKLSLRAWAIELAVRCAHAGIAATGGAANGRNHPAQRVYREALVYTVSAQTGTILQATLERIASRSGGLSAS